MNNLLDDTTPGDDASWFHKNWLLVLALSIAIVLAILVILGYTLGWQWVGVVEFNYQSAPDTVYERSKTLWEWMELLIIPLVLAFGVAWLNKTERENDRELAKKKDQTDRQLAIDRQRQTLLEGYLDKMTTLLLDKELGSATAEEDEDEDNLAPTRSLEVVRDLARTRTLIAVGNLDGVRKAQVIQFLYESELLYGATREPIVNLSLADLSEMQMAYAELNLINLSRVNLAYADLSWARLKGANLYNTTLREANLRGINLERANLREARLVGTDLRFSNLIGANLADAKPIYEEQIYRMRCLPMLRYKEFVMITKLNGLKVLILKIQQ